MSTDVNAALFSSGNNEFRFRTLQKYAKKNHFVTPEDIENSTDFAYRLTALLERLEENIRWKVEIERGSPSYGLFILYRPDKKAIQRGREALIASKAIVQLINTLCVG
ncbi:hypothetical protein JTB14_013725 [Gonioctena quinquepunctata]|nr:hypothetical protein JTB14_013725 [Gonioctena quinquepunctata]